MNRYVKWAAQPHSPRQRFGVLIPAGVFFLLLLPGLLIRLSRALDRRLRLPRLGPATRWPGLAAMGGGLAFALRTIQMQFQQGQGTPLPMLPTQSLLATGPYAHCRNPMTLGTAVAYLGLGLWLGSLSAVGLVAGLTGLLLLYIKRAEEPELAARFGMPYLEYKAQTPFFFPRLNRTAR